MQEEIFGPVLPMLPFDDTDEAPTFVNERENRWHSGYFGPEKPGSGAAAPRRAAYASTT